MLIQGYIGRMNGEIRNSSSFFFFFKSNSFPQPNYRAISDMRRVSNLLMNVHIHKILF